MSDPRFAPDRKPDAKLEEKLTPREIINRALHEALIPLETRLKAYRDAVDEKSVSQAWNAIFSHPVVMNSIFSDDDAAACLKNRMLETKLTEFIAQNQASLRDHKTPKAPAVFYREKITQGIAYYGGLGIKQDRDIAFRYFDLLNETFKLENTGSLGHSGACQMLGHFYRSKGDLQKALGYFQNAAHLGNAAAQNWLGHGETIPAIKKNPAETFRYYGLAAQNGYPLAFYYVGLCYSRGTGIVKDEKESIKYFHRAACLGYSPALHALGNRYKDGIVVAQDKQTAAYFYRAGLLDDQFEIAHEAYRDTLEDLINSVGDKPDAPIFYHAGMALANTRYLREAFETDPCAVLKLFQEDIAADSHPALRNQAHEQMQQFISKYKYEGHATKALSDTYKVIAATLIGGARIGPGFQRLALLAPPNPADVDYPPAAPGGPAPGPPKIY